MKNGQQAKLLKGLTFVASNYARYHRSVFINGVELFNINVDFLK